MKLPEVLIQIAQFNIKEKINIISNEMIYPISKSLAGVISPLFYQALEANPMLKEISLPITANIKEFFMGKSIDRELFLKMSILINNKDLIKKWKKENEINKENAIDHLMTFIQYKGEIEDMKEEIEFIGKHVEEMEYSEEFEKIPCEYLSEIFKKAKGIQSEKRIYKYIIERIKEEKSEKTRKKLLEGIDFRGLHSKYFLKLIKHIKNEDLSEPLFSMIKDIIFSNERMKGKKELSSKYQYDIPSQGTQTEVSKSQSEMTEKKKEQTQNVDKEEKTEILWEKFQQEYQNSYNSPYQFLPLHYAAKNNYSKYIGEILISKGKDINAKDIIYQIIVLLFLINIIYMKSRKNNYKNKTPLHIASENNSKEIGELLISKGADINAKDVIYQITTIFFKLRFF